MTIDTAVVPVAGRGTRLWPLTRATPKELLPIGRSTVLDHVFAELALAGIGRAVYVNSDEKPAIDRHVESLRRSPPESPRLPELVRARQEEMRGLGDAVRAARAAVGDRPFALALGDALIGLRPTPSALLRMFDVFTREDAAVVIAFEEVPIEAVSAYGIALPETMDPVFRLKDVVEKPSPADAPSRLAVAARYVLSPAIFPAIDRTSPGKGGEIQITDAIRRVIADGKKAFGVRLMPDERRSDIGTVASYTEAFVRYALTDPDSAAAIRHVMEHHRAGGR